MDSTASNHKNKIFKSPWLEAVIMVAALVLSFAALAVISARSEIPLDQSMPTRNIVLYLAAYFIISFLIAVIAVMAGIGGGVIFTPVMMAFTPVDSLIIRGTGLIVAMFSGLISTGIFMKKGIGNLKLSTLLTTSQGIGAFLGAQGAIIIYRYLGNQGEAFIRIILGLILIAISIYFFKNGQKMEWPVVNNVDKFTKWLNLSHSYYEESENRIVEYKVKKAGVGMFCTFLIGLIGGFFGMGGGWAIVPVQNLIMGAPLKVAAANSGVILGMVDCIGVWPYILIGAIIPLFVLPWLAGQVVGGYLGSLLLVKIKSNIVRLILIGIMFFTSFGLITKGCELLKLLKVSPVFTLIVFTVISIFTAIAIIKTHRGGKISCHHS